MSNVVTDTHLSNILRDYGLAPLATQVFIEHSKLHLTYPKKKDFMYVNMSMELSLIDRNTFLACYVVS